MKPKRLLASWSHRKDGEAKVQRKCATRRGKRGKKKRGAKKAAAADEKKRVSAIKKESSERSVGHLVRIQSDVGK